MIILDEDDQQIPKEAPFAGPTVRLPEPPPPLRHRAPSILPDYETSQAIALTDFSDSRSIIHDEPSGPRKIPLRRRFDARFWKATLCALSIYITISLAIGIPLIVIKSRDSSSTPYTVTSYAYTDPWTSQNPELFYSTKIISLVQNGSSAACNSWKTVNVTGEGADAVYDASMKYNVDANGQFSFNSNATVHQSTSSAHPSMGTLHVGINPDPTSTSAQLFVHLRAMGDAAWNGTQVCPITWANGSDLSIYVPQNTSIYTSLNFNITLLFPNTTAHTAQFSPPSFVDNFATYLPLFYQNFGKLGSAVWFDRTSLGGALGAVEVGSIQANNWLVQTALAPISGAFTVWGSLELGTINAPIVANITAYNDPVGFSPTYITLDTGNSELTTNLTLLPSTNTSCALYAVRPNFIGALRTFNGSLTIGASVANRLALILRASSDLAPAHVQLDSGFEGVFQAVTRLARVDVILGPGNGGSGGNGTAGEGGVSTGTIVSPSGVGAVDPSGRNRPRTYDIAFNTSSQVYGWVGWGSGPGIGDSDTNDADSANSGTVASNWEGTAGHVVVQSSLSPVTLVLDGP